jgi:hypothetical protein
MTTKKINILIVLLFLKLATSAQNFKDIFETMPQLDRFSNMMNLRQYQSENPDHAIAYYLLGDIHDQYMRETNPLVLFDVLQTNFTQLETYWGLGLAKLDEKQARQDREYYGTVELISDNKKAGIVDIQNKLKKRLTEARQYYDNALKVHKNYIRCINKYNECLFKYREILADYPDYKTLFLLANPKLIGDIQTIATNFDSSLMYFDTYKESCAAMAHLLKVNTYQLKKIETYRLEGLIETDFALPVVPLWDFKMWAKSSLAVIDTDIAQIKKGIVDNDNALSNQIDQLKNTETYADDRPFYRTEDKLQNLIAKYDHASLCNELIDYKQAKIQYLLKTRSKVNEVSDSSKFFLINKLWFFSDLSKTKTSLNEQADQLKKSISLEDIGKNFDFYAKQYKGMDGLTRWCEVEKRDNDLVFNKNLFNLKKSIELDKQQNMFTDSLVVYQKKKIAFGVQYPDWQNLKADTTLTTGFNTFKNKWHFLTGYEVDKKLVRKPFVAKVNKQGAVEWMINPGIDKMSIDSGMVINDFQMLDDSTFYLVGNAKISGTVTEKQHQTVVSKYNWQGKQLKQRLIDQNYVPLYFDADEINEQYLLITKLALPTETASNEQTMKIALYSFTDSLLWSNQVTIKGNLVNVMRVNSNFIISLNYEALQFSKPEQRFTSNGQNSNFACFFIDQAGDIKWINTYEITEKMKLTACYKLTSDELNFIGEVKDEQEQVKEIFYLLTEVQGNPTYSNVSNLTFKTWPITQ